MNKIKQPPGATLIDLDELEELVPPHITNLQQLNEWEQNNILDAERWAFNVPHKR